MSTISTGQIAEDRETAGLALLRLDGGGATVQLTTVAPIMLVCSIL